MADKQARARRRRSGRLHHEHDLLAADPADDDARLVAPLGRQAELPTEQGGVRAHATLLDGEPVSFLQAAA